MSDADTAVPDPVGERARDDGPPRAHRALLLISMFIIGACGLLYELVAGAIASYLLGDSVTQYSLVIGVFLAAMGFGAFLTQWVRSELLAVFLKIQIAVGLVGGFSGLAMFWAFAHSDMIVLVVLGICATVGTLVGMEIPLVVRILKRDVSLRVNVAQVMTFDYLGALGASVAFPFLVLPLLGPARAALVFGMLNVLIASVGTAFFARELPRPRRLWAWNLGAWIALMIGLALCGRTTAWIEDRLYQDEIVFAETTPYQRIVITRWQNDIRLHLNGHLQFSSADEYRYHESLMRPALAAAVANTRAPLRVLILGGGDGLAARQAFGAAPIERIDLVDIDRRVVELFRDREMLSALNDGSLSRPELHTHFEDAMVFLQGSPPGAYDVIVMDLPDPSDVGIARLYSSTFYGLALRRLAPGGVLVTQATSPFYAREAYWCVANTIQEAISGLPDPGEMCTVPYHAYVPSFGDWGFVMATSVPIDAATLDQLGSEPLFMTGEVFDQARAFGPDAAVIQTEVNRLDHPVIARYHRQGWARWNE